MKVVSIDQDIFAFPYTACSAEINLLKEKGIEVEGYSDKPVPTEEDLYERMKDAEIVFWGIYSLPNSLLERCKKLKVLIYYGVGYESYVDEEYCKSRGILILNTPNYGNNTVAEYAVGLAFALTRHICKADRRMRNSDWRSQGLEGQEIAGMTYGIVGTGAIGNLVARKASLLGANVIAFDIKENEELKKDFNVKYVSLEELMSCADIVSLHLNVWDSTIGIITEKLINSMKDGSYFINCARSAIVESYEPVYRRVKDGTLAGAAIDVFDSEPIASFEPCYLENIITSPHIGYLTTTAMCNTLKIAIDKTMEYLQKE